MRADTWSLPDSAGLMPGKEIQLYCTREEADQLLAIAQKDCKGAVHDINKGIRLGDEERLAEKKS